MALKTPVRFLSILPYELSLSAVLRNGQCFRWNKHADSDEWSIGYKDRTLILKQEATGLYYSSLYAPKDKDAYTADLQQDTTRSIIQSYLALDITLKDLYQEWQRLDPNFVKQTANGRYAGIRVLKQDPWETLVGFISSSNNNIARISLMIRKLCEALGSVLPSYQDQMHYSFPSPELLAREGTDEHLRQLGFGYRAPYIQRTAQLLCELAEEAQISPSDYLESLKKLPYKEAKESLLQFTGVGPKVADCVALFGLGFTNVVPVDTHVWQIAVRDYGFKGKEAKGPVGNIVYEKVQDHLQKIWGTYAGWAQQILFTADLAAFANFVDPLSTPTVEKAMELLEQNDVKVDLHNNPYPTPDITPKKRKQRGQSPGASPTKRKPIIKIEQKEGDMAIAEKPFTTSDSPRSLRLARRVQNFNS